MTGLVSTKNGAAEARFRDYAFSLDGCRCNPPPHYNLSTLWDWCICLTSLHPPKLSFEYEVLGGDATTNVIFLLIFTMPCYLVTVKGAQRSETSAQRWQHIKSECNFLNY